MHGIYWESCQNAGSDSVGLGTASKSELITSSQEQEGRERELFEFCCFLNEVRW